MLAHREQKETEKVSLIKNYAPSNDEERQSHQRGEQREMDGTKQNLDLVMMKFVPIILHDHYYCNLHFMLAQLNFQ